MNGNPLVLGAVGVLALGVVAASRRGSRDEQDGEFFHVTEAENVPDILASGFLPGWGDVGFGVYFYGTYESARAYARKGGWDKKLRHPALLVVRDPRIRKIESYEIHGSWDASKYADMYVFDGDENNEDAPIRFAEVIDEGPIPVTKAKKGSRAVSRFGIPPRSVTIQVALPDAIRRNATHPDFTIAWPSFRPDDGVHVVDDRYGNMLEILVASGGKLSHPLSSPDCIRAWQKLSALSDYFRKLRFPLRVYRGVRMTRSAIVATGFDGMAVHEEDWTVNPQAGNHWTVNRQIANRFATGEHDAANFEPDFEREGGLPAHEVLLSGIVERPEDVNWHRTLTDYLVYTLGSEGRLNTAEEQVNSSRVTQVKSIPVRR